MQIDPEDIFGAYFATGIHSTKYACLQTGRKAGVCYHAGGSNVTLTGDIAILSDQASKSRFWRESFYEFFPLGDSDPAYCILKFTTRRVLLWIDGESASFSVDELLTVQSRCGLLCAGCAYRASHGCGECAETDGHPFHGECPIAVCCRDKGYRHCGQCPQIPCDQLRAYSYDDPDHGDCPPGARIEVCKAWAERGDPAGL
jgi:general stress protein 26